jgi:TatD DNase family protein
MSSNSLKPTESRSSRVRLIDTHCHLDFADFDADRQAVINQAQTQGVSDIIVPAVSAAQWQKTIKICAEYDFCHLGLGLHPMFIEQHQPQHLSELNQLVKKHKPIAIGEIGLDFYLSKADREKQLVYFDKQLIIAKQASLPVIIHNRKAHDECIKLLQKHNLVGGIIHAFNGSLQQAKKYTDMGFLLGFGGMLTYTRSRKLRELALATPLQHMALETDAPDMTVSQHQGARNSPAYLTHVVEAIADIKQVERYEVAQTTSTNIERIFLI